MRASAATPGRHRVYRRLLHRRMRQTSRLLKALDRVRQCSHLPYDRRDLHLRGHHGMGRARLRRGEWWRGFLPTGRVSRRSSSSRPLSPGSCHLRKILQTLWRSCAHNRPPYLARQTCCGQSPRRLVVGNEHLQEKPTLIGDASNGDPLTIKSERRLGNSRKESERLSGREREIVQGLRKNLLAALLPSPFYSRARRGAAINDADNWGSC